ncbi:hypothetical protein EZV62_007359 [Acer yangbiense]|uniref:Uncharacterized protein n=1 Tax=Acer yangbiense TaxID=1000413 RepID=A0A5C7IA73_9ROSI|nr:hypothetical protein EZV62_007359 [Acer yangbiense]
MIGTQEVKGIMLDKSEQRITHVNGKSFSGMRNLRLLKISNVDLSEDIEYLSNELRFLKWPKYPSTSLPSNFQSQELFELNLCRNRIKYLWKDMKAFPKLKTIKLSNSHNLIETPDFTMVPNLEILDVEGCTRLCTVHKSVGLLERLTILNLKDCKNLVNFPNDVSGLKLLKILNLQGCSELNKLPQNLGELERLEELDVGGTAIRQVPSSIARLTNLKTLSFRECKGHPPQSRMSSFFSLQLPRKHPNTMCLLLPPLSENCQWLQSLPELPPDIIFLGAENCPSLEDVSSVLRGSTSPNIALHFFNCLKLRENQGQENNLEVMLLQQYLQQPVNPFGQFHIRLPGSEIPEWFKCKSDGNSVKIGLPPNWLNDELMGIAMCGVFAPAPEDLDPLQSMGCKMFIMRNEYCFCFEMPSFTNFESDHLWLAYVSRVEFEHDYSPPLSSYLDHLQKSELDPSYIPPQIEPYGSDHEWVGDSTCIHAMFQTFKAENSDSKVIKCGIRPVYKQDIQYFQESPPAEGSIFHQNHNCSTGFGCRCGRLYMPTKLEHHCKIRRNYSR